MDMRPRKRTITRRAMLTTVLMGATAALLTEATRPAFALTPTTATMPIEAPKQGSDYVVTFLTTQTNPSDVKIYEDLAAAFNGTVPGVSVKITAESGTNIDQKLLTYLTAGTLPDIVQTNDNFAKPYKDNKITQNMIPYAEASGFPWRDFDPTFLNLGLVDGELHMLPKQGDIILPYVNLRMAKDAGVTAPVDFNPAANPDGWTWAEFEQMYKRMSVDVNGRRGDEAGFDKDNVAVYGLAWNVDQWYSYVPMVLAEGGSFVSDDGTRATINNAAGIQAFRNLTQPIIDGYWAPLTLIQTMNNQAGNIFASGQAAMCPAQRLWIPSFRDGLIPQGDDFDIMHFPKGSTKRITGMGTFGFAMTTSAKNPEAAWKFLEFMYGEQGMQIITSSYSAVPAMQRFYNSGFWRDLPGPPYHNAAFVDSFSYGTTPPRIPFYSTGPFRQAVTDGMVSIVLGKSSVEDVVANVEKELNTILAARR
jgi:multiple sugar transport system substrate-binding protein